MFMFLKGDTVITGIDTTIEADQDIKVPAGTRGIIFSYLKAANGEDDVDCCRIIFGFKDKSLEGWMMEWQPISTRMVLTEKTIMPLTMREFDMIKWMDK